MKKRNVILALLSTLLSAVASAQATAPAKPVKTGNEWKMPSDVFKRSRIYANNLKKQLDLDSLQTEKVYAAFLANTKPLDEIGVLPISQEQKDRQIKANKAAFDEKLKGIFSAAQFNKYKKIEGSPKR